MTKLVRGALVSGAVWVVVTLLSAGVTSCGERKCSVDLAPGSGSQGNQVSLQACVTCGKKSLKEEGTHVDFTSAPDCPCGGSTCSLCTAPDPVTGSDGCLDASLSLTDTSLTNFQVTVTASAKSTDDSSAYVLNATSGGTPTPGGSTTPSPTRTPTPGTPTPAPTAVRCAPRDGACPALPCCTGQCVVNTCIG